MKKIQLRKGTEHDIVDLVAMLCRYKSDVTAIVDGEKYNAKSIMSAYVLKDARKIDITIDGDDENQVEEEINRKFISNKNEGEE
ncbi:MAG: HPr family phosphocarrier protein [Lachnospiraceae bacterium]|nr:HPr family phosphocarrier protein [Lachnospiraceae bacterium]